MLTRKRATAVVALAALLAVPIMLAGSTSAGAAVSDQLTLAQAARANCSLLAGKTTGAQHTRAVQCINDQTAIIALLTATAPPTTTPPPTTVPPTTTPPATTPPPSPTPTPTPAPTGPAPAGACLPHPGACGYPDDTTTGVPAGMALTPAGGFTANVAGKVYQGLDVAGCINVTAPNVTIRDSRIRDGGCAWVITGAATGLVLDHVTVSCLNSPHKAVVVQQGGTLTAVRLSGCEDGAWFDPPGGTLENSYINGMFDNSGGLQQHTDVVQLAAGAKHVRIVHNTLINDDQSGSSVLTDDTPGSADVTISGNLTAGGGYSIRYPGSGTAPDFYIMNNRMSPVLVQYNSGAGFLQGCASCVTTISGNFRDDTGAAINP